MAFIGRDTLSTDEVLAHLQDKAKIPTVLYKLQEFDKSIEEIDVDLDHLRSELQGNSWLPAEEKTKLVHKLSIRAGYLSERLVSLETARHTYVECVLSE